jgi:tetratricopeptide (TPR) repeat protein
LYGHSNLLIVAQQELQLALALSQHHEYVAALPHLERALAEMEHSEAAESADVASVVGQLAVAYGHTGARDKARAMYQRAIEIREQKLGKDNPMLIPTLNNLADMLRRNGDAAGARPYVERAIAIGEKSLGKAHPLLQQIETTYVEVLASDGHLADARTYCDALLAREDQGHSPVLQQTLASRAQIEVEAGDYAKAVSLATRSVALVEAKSGKDAPDLWEPLAAQGRALAALGKRDQAKPVLERALTIAKSVQLEDYETAPVREALSKL